MWWTPELDRETANTVFRLADYFQTPGQMISGVRGVGSTIGIGGRRVPLLVIDGALAPGRLDLATRRLRIGRFVSLDEAGFEIRRLLERWEVPLDTQLLISNPPRALNARTGIRIWAEQRDATLGFRVRVRSREVFTTAGHLVRSLPCPVVTRSRRPFGRGFVEPVGSVSFWSDPKPPPATGAVSGVDVAIVEHDGENTDGGSRVAALVDPPSVPDLAPVISFGARSRHRRGWINGALQATRALDGRIWKNCWTVVGFSGGFAKQGDSGGPVILEGGEVLGHVVCALGAKSWMGRFQCGLVQDIHTIVEYVRLKYGDSPTVLQPGYPN